MFERTGKTFQPAPFWVENGRVADGGDHWCDSVTRLPLTIRRCMDEAVMMLVAEGTVAGRGARDDLMSMLYLPTDDQTIEPFYLDRSPVRLRQLEAFVEGTFGDVTATDADEGSLAHTSYDVIRAYARAVGARLPTEAEIAWSATGMRDLPSPALFDMDEDIRAKQKASFYARQRKTRDESNRFGILLLDETTATSTLYGDYISRCRSLEAVERARLSAQFADHLLRCSFQYVFPDGPDKQDWQGFRLALTASVYRTRA